ncbi:hypothetical protein AVEN_58425-1 [Araneus ventricosus]|uniref:Uncharacterized protein n=1 Tax=Araneus ventricosus TaxID=182803 RepID=A0A4Y2N4E7_ARAVE|nr:hypothetical protein AVEN_58425-1 [Araneus ventricosus]
MHEIFTAITRETTDALTNPRVISILPVPTTGNKANRGRNLWKDRPLERSLRGGSYQESFCTKVVEAFRATQDIEIELNFEPNGDGLHAAMLRGNS